MYAEFDKQLPIKTHIRLNMSNTERKELHVQTWNYNFHGSNLLTAKNTLISPNLLM